MCFENKFCQFTKNDYFCICKRGEIRLLKESAFSLYSDCVNFDNSPK